MNGALRRQRESEGQVQLPGHPVRCRHRCVSLLWGRVLDLAAPVAVLMIDVLHHIPDTDNPIQFIQAYVDAVCPGRYMAVAHPSDGGALLRGLAMFHRFYQIPIPPLTFRTLAQIEDFFTELDLVEPGIVPIPLRHPEQGEDADTDPEHFPGWCGLGRKP